MKKRNWDCVFCGKSLRTYTDNLSHILSHIRERPYLCKLCGKSLTTKRHLKGHRKLCHPASEKYERQKKFRCNICDKLFLAQCYLDRHQLTHSTEKPYQCDLCPAKFNLPHYLEHHRKRHQNARFKCQVCGVHVLRNMRTSHHLQYHPEVKLGEGMRARKWNCVFCKKSLQIHREIDKECHMRSHIKEKPFFCKLCDKSFTRKPILKSHLKACHPASGKDERQKNFRCAICDKLFLTKQNRDNHQVTHSTKKSYQCDLCPAKFKLRRYLEQHRKRHRETRFNCQVCGIELLRNMLPSHRLQCHPGTKLVRRGRSKNADTGETVKVKVKEERKLKKPNRSVWKAALEKLEAKRDQLIVDIQLQEGQGQGERQRQEGEGHGAAIDLVANKKKTKSDRRKKKIKYKCRFCPASFRTMEFLENHFMTVHKGNVDLDEDDENEEENSPVLFLSEVPIVVESKQDTETHPESEFEVVTVTENGGGRGGEVEIQNRKRNKKKKKRKILE